LQIKVGIGIFIFLFSRILARILAVSYVISQRKER